ncbi:ATP-dependent helicase HrpB [Citricoccus sp. NR2]|uniref:ATP-dependent helicase HrpB n=1 Tax=Citricoccus sp. NR2 TaxID=3004095 RepID=UPI0022DD96E1|nr:ATP-dependent helicase HrpB [Citricoccus sp. NR2]WBL18829.1 ATP-dependent helicase HrpB [Citricoccus sp. NR2]
MTNTPAAHQPADSWEIPWERIVQGLPAARLVPQLTGLAGCELAEQAELTAPGTDSGAGTAGIRVVISAPPGSGKTTVVPPALAAVSAGRVVVTQPRRMAARAAARRLVSLSGAQLGREVGYTVRGDRHVSAATRVEFVTTGVLLRRLIADPEASGIGAIVLDEVHERHLDTDLTFALVEQLGQLRPELHVVVMSATLDVGHWAELLGARVLEVATEPHPLQEIWAPWGTQAQRSLDARGVAPGFLDHVADVVVEYQHLHQYPHTPVGPDRPGDTLVFLPGAREIDRVAARLGSDPRLAPDTAVLPLLGSMPAREQDRILARSTDTASQFPRRIVLATNVAESALTVPGVRLVVDAGLERALREDSRRGVSGLITLGASKSAMVQRGGRAAREAPGTVVRCLSEAEYAARPAHTAPEIRTAGRNELGRALLDVACWGAPRGAGLRLPDPFPTAAADRAEQRLQELGAVHDDGTPTELGARMSRLPVDPHLGRALLDGAELWDARVAAEAVATLAADTRAPGADLMARYRQLRSDPGWRHDVDRLARAAVVAEDLAPQSTGHDDAGGPLDQHHLHHDALGLITALAYPQQIARRRDAEYLLASGTAARLPASSSLIGAEWIAVAELSLHGDHAVIRAAVELDPEHAELAAGPLLVDETVARLDAASDTHRRVTARRIRRLGAIELSSTPVPPQPEHARSAVVAEWRETGVLALVQRAGASVATLRNRLGFLHRVYGAPWPEVTDAALTATVEDWLGPEIDQLAAGAAERSLDLHSALRRLLPWPEAARFDELAPLRLTVPSGSQITLDWPAPEDHPSQNNPDADTPAPPVLAVKLQECFGWRTGPTVAEGRVPVLLHLLSPAGRPLAVTSDLNSFWENAYPAVRAENRARYAKHPWPEDPWTAVATPRTNSAMRRIPPS